MTELKPVVIYHDPCLDGIASAWCLHHKFHGEVILHGAQYGDDLPDSQVVLDRDVYIVDFSYPTAELNTLAIYANTVTVIDHHESAIRKIDKKKLVPNVSCILDTNEAGCTLTWEYCFPDAPAIPKLLSYIADRDLGRFDLIQTKPVCTALFSYPLEVETIADVIKHNTYDHLVYLGTILMAQTYKQIAWHIEHCKVGLYLGSIHVPAFHAPYTIASDLAATFLADNSSPVVAVYESAGDKGWKVSLRSRKGDCVNVARIAETFGGGGHKSAAGFYVKSIEEMLR